MKDYSQFGEQKIILDFFEKRGQKNGTFLSIGENDGETLSNVRALALLGWGGVMVEPSEIAYTKLRHLYTHEIHQQKTLCFNYAIGNKVGKAKFYDSGKHLTDNDHSLLSTLKESELSRWKGSEFDNFTETEVDVVTFEWMMNDNKLFDKFDFINIDAEGMDLDILRQMNLEELEVKLLCIEHNGQQGGLSKMTDYCRSYGLKMLWSNTVNVMFYKP